MLLSFLFLLIAGDGAYGVDGYNTDTVDFRLTYQGNNINNKDRALRFSTGFNPENRLFLVANNLTECKNLCTYNQDCRGVFQWHEPTYDLCAGLNDLGRAASTQSDSYSYTKYVFYNNHLNNNTIEGFVWNTNGKKSYVYIDLNHDEIYNPNEPLLLVDNFDSFYFRNLSEGTYIVRQIPPENCIPYWPDIYGSGNTIWGDGFPNKVVEFVTHGGGLLLTPYGGLVNDSSTWNTPVNLSYVLGNNSNQFLSLPPNSHIILGFLDEVIRDEPGDDIFIYDFGNRTNTFADIYISSNNYNYSYLGRINSLSNISRFDLSDIGYTSIVKYLKIVSLPSNTNSFDLIGARANNQSVGYPSYAYSLYLGNDGFYNYYPFFINYCNYEEPCEEYCSWLFSDNQISVCQIGCQFMRNDSNCNQNYNTSYDIHNCNIGYNYEVGQTFFPNYTLLPNTIGSSEHHHSSQNDLVDYVNNCTEDDECEMVSFGEEIRLYDTLGISQSNNYSTLIKSNVSTIDYLNITIDCNITNCNCLHFEAEHSFMDDNNCVQCYCLHNHDYVDSTTVTSTPTSTVTSTPTSTMTSSLTSTMTSSATSTMTSSATSTITSSATSTMTSSATSTMTSTNTSTVTTTDSSTQTTTPSSSISFNKGSTNSQNLEFVIPIIVIVILILALLLYLFKIKRRNVNINPQNSIDYNNPTFNQEPVVYEQDTLFGDENRSFANQTYYQDVFPSPDENSISSNEINENYIEVRAESDI